MVDGGTGGGNAVFFPAALGVVVDLGGVKESFGGHTAFIETDAAQRTGFKENHAHTFVSGTLSGTVSGGTAADNKQIVSHFSSSLW